MIFINYFKLHYTKIGLIQRGFKIDCSLSLSQLGSKNKCNGWESMGSFILINEIFEDKPLPSSTLFVLGKSLLN